MRKTKIICTIGPASGSEETLREMILAGMNVARLNMSHGDHKDHAEKIGLIKKLRKELGLPVAILIDTKGIEIRLRTFENGGVTLKTGDRFTFTTKDVIGNKERVSVNFPDLCKTMKEGGRIMVDDGLVEFGILRVGADEVECEVLNDGEIRDRKGVNLPETRIDLPFLSQADKEDLAFGVEQGADFFALSFTRCSKDVDDARAYLKGLGGVDIELIAKIENREGVENAGEIIDAAEGVMIARGDMGVEIPYEELPYIQKSIITSCNATGKTAITATQMLESMIVNPRPTRAEITDVANAVYDGTAAVMLSGETSVGKYPVKTIETMVKITESTEATIDYKWIADHTFEVADEGASIIGAISHAACATAHSLDADAILAVTISGGTARELSRFRPQTQVIAVTPTEKTYYQLALCWGVRPLMNEYVEDADELLRDAVLTAEEEGLIKNGDLVVITGSTGYSPGGNNSIQVYAIK